MTHPTPPTEDTPIPTKELREALTAMHKGLLGMQARLDDHEKVIEKLIAAMTNISDTLAPKKGFRQPPK